MSNRIPMEELETYLWSSANLLRSSIDAGAYKQYIFPLLFFKRICDVYDEECQNILEEFDGDESALEWEENHLFMVPKGAHWNDVRNKTENIGAALVDAFSKIQSANSEKLQGIFGDAAWTNKNRLPDRLLKDLIEHFSSKTLSLANCPEDELGQGYEYLIKQFADDSGHTAQEFYTNRTVVHLMTEMLKPQSGESIYDPTCGSAGMLISAIAYLKEKGLEWRNVSAYGQEINSLTSAIGRMNLFLHGVKDFNIVNDDTLARPAFIENGTIKTFNVTMANPPYSISQWDRAAFSADKYGRNKFGVPPQARADYAFIQHIVSSLDISNGRAAILLPHGVLNRNEEKDIRTKLIQTDCIEAVIGLGRHLFYNSGLESCILVLRNNKRINRKNKILFIDAENCTHKVQAQNFLFEEDIKKICSAYEADYGVEDFSVFVDVDEVLKNDGNLNIKLYVNNSRKKEDINVENSLFDYIDSRDSFYESIRNVSTDNLFESVIGGVEGKWVPFDKSSWKRVKLSDIAYEYSERVEKPSESEYEWYIGSDNIDGFDFRITSKTSSSKINSSQKAFQEGDYLLVRRSLYGSDFRERAPRANFSGVCSADILTIREKSDVIADGFLIAILYSKGLWKFIVSNSTGSLTRRIKWKQLAEYEFLLPPIEEQERISKLLWSMYEVRCSYKKLFTKTEEFVKSQFIEMFGELDKNTKQFPVRKLSEISSYWNGLTYKPADAVKDGTGTLVLRSSNIQNGALAFEDNVYVNCDIKEKLLVQENDILMCSRNGSAALVGKTALIKGLVEPTTFGAFMMIIRSEYYSYLKTYFEMPFFRNQISTGTSTINQITGKMLNEISLPVPDMDTVRLFEAFVHQSDKSKYEIKKSIQYMEQLYKGYIFEMEG